MVGYYSSSGSPGGSTALHTNNNDITSIATEIYTTVTECPFSEEYNYVLLSKKDALEFLVLKM